MTYDPIYQRTYREANRAGLLAYARVYSRAYRESHPEQDRAYRATHPEERHAYHLLQTLDLPIVEYNSQSRWQEGRCWICHQPETVIRYGKVIRLAVDHDHTTGAIRGLLCNRCNTGVDNLEKGRNAFGRDPFLTACAHRYLEVFADA